MICSFEILSIVILNFSFLNNNDKELLLFFNAIFSIYFSFFYRSRTPTSSRSPSSASMGRPASVGAGPRPPTVGTPEENSAKRIKMEENSRKSGHVSFIQ